MDEKLAGFKIVYDDAQNILKLRLNGFWNTTVNRQFEQEFHDKVTQIAAMERDWYFLIDLLEYRPQPQETQNILCEAMTFAKHSGMQQMAIITNGSISTFPIDTCSDLHIHFYFKSEKDAIRWFLNKTE